MYLVLHTFGSGGYPLGNVHMSTSSSGA